jgi:hypothetical protein
LLNLKENKCKTRGLEAEKRKVLNNMALAEVNDD